MSSFEEVVATLNQKVTAAAPFGKKINFSVDGKIVHIDGTTTPPSLSLGDTPADVTISASLEDFVKVMNKQMNPQMAMMMGKIKLQGDMMAAMALQKIF